jgi:hypothetical protein
MTLKKFKELQMYQNCVASEQLSQYNIAQSIINIPLGVISFDSC